MSFKIKPSLVIDNNIIPRLNISMSKYTESVAMTKVLYHTYTINIIDICLNIVSSIRRYMAYLKSRIVIGNQDLSTSDSLIAEKIERAKVKCSTRI